MTNGHSDKFFECLSRKSRSPEISLGNPEAQCSSGFRPSLQGTLITQDSVLVAYSTLALKTLGSIQISQAQYRSGLRPLCTQIELTQEYFLRLFSLFECLWNICSQKSCKIKEMNNSCQMTFRSGVEVTFIFLTLQYYNAESETTYDKSRDPIP